MNVLLSCFSLIEDRRKIFLVVGSQEENTTKSFSRSQIEQKLNPYIIIIFFPGDSKCFVEREEKNVIIRLTTKFLIGCVIDDHV